MEGGEMNKELEKLEEWEAWFHVGRAVGGIPDMMEDIIAVVLIVLFLILA
jgi:hypothetical protein